MPLTALRAVTSSGLEQANSVRASKQCLYCAERVRLRERKKEREVIYNAAFVVMLDMMLALRWYRTLISLEFLQHMLAVKSLEAPFLRLESEFSRSQFSLEKVFK